MLLTIGYSTRKIDENFHKHIKDTVGLKENEYEIIPIENNGVYGLSEAYNIILDKSKSDIVVLMHDDIKIEPNWGKKLLLHFNKGTHNIIGVAGTTNFPKSGMWWENKESMTGIVKHSKDGKTWVNKYSESQGYDIKSVVIVDGLFIAFDKTKIKHKFDEEFKGFHFYDIAFCFPNYIDGVNIGVVTDIRITHLSIGETNQQWEENRKQFVEKYKNELPNKCKIDKPNILISCLNFRNYTGSEIYVYELSRALKKLGCNVTIYSNIKNGSDLPSRALKNGIKLIDFTEKLIGNYDILHLQHKPIIEHFLKLNLKIPIITTVHSEVIELENPILNDKIEKYICIRPEIQKYIINNFNIPIEKTKIIYNPFDTKRFNNNFIKNTKKTVLFVGTIDYLRKNSIEHLISDSLNNNYDVIIVGNKYEKYLDYKLPNNVKYYKSTWDIEKYIKKSTHCAGILLGRSTIEGWLSGLETIIYNVDNIGNILSIDYETKLNDYNLFDSNNIAIEMLTEYKKIIN